MVETRDGGRGVWIRGPRRPTVYALKTKKKIETRTSRCSREERLEAEGGESTSTRIQRRNAGKRAEENARFQEWHVRRAGGCAVCGRGPNDGLPSLEADAQERERRHGKARRGKKGERDETTGQA